MLFSALDTTCLAMTADTISTSVTFSRTEEDKEGQKHNECTQTYASSSGATTGHNAC